MLKITENLYCYQDICNVYIIRSGNQAVLIDFGDGAILNEIEEIGVGTISDVLITHHHRDQCQGLNKAQAAGIRIWAPHTEQDLFQEVAAHWQAREVFNNYNVRQDRFSLLEPIQITGTLKDYEQIRLGNHCFQVIPTPGHTPGSLSLLAEIDGQRIAFTGDLIAAPGKVWSLAATQWTYNGAEGVAASVASLLDLKDRAPDVLLPSHGDPISAPESAIDLLIYRLAHLLEHRCENLRLFELRSQPYMRLTPHLLFNRTSVANSYVLISDSGKAMLIDFGYDFVTGMAAGADRAARRPWLYTLEALKREYGVHKIDVVLPTHYHDDHVAGFNLLRDVEGAQVWAAENFAPILAKPSCYDLPCLWYDPIPVDRILPMNCPIQWEEYELTLHELAGHTFFAVAIAFIVDGVRVLATGDQYKGEDGQDWNYVYQNGFRSRDYRLSAALYRQIEPDLILPGHWQPLWAPEGYLERLAERGAVLERLHQELLPAEIQRFQAEGFGVRLLPYQVSARGGERLDIEVEVLNPLPEPEEAVVRLIIPAGWQIEADEIRLQINPCDAGRIHFYITPPEGLSQRRARLAADVTIGRQRYGQIAEALVTVI